MLSNIALKSSEYDKAIKFLDRGIRLDLNSDIINNFKLIKVSILKDQGKPEIAQKILDEILKEEKLPNHLKRLSEELIGMM